MGIIDDVGVLFWCVVIMAIVIVYFAARNEFHRRALEQRTAQIEQFIKMLDESGIIEMAQTALGKRQFVERQVKLFNEQRDYEETDQLTP